MHALVIDALTSGETLVLKEVMTAWSETFYRSAVLVLLHVFAIASPYAMDHSWSILKRNYQILQNT